MELSVKANTPHNEKNDHILALLSAAITLSAQQVDPYHTATGGFGYPVASNPEATLWWAEGAYKIMQDMPVPKGKARPAEIL